jgi:hypothetical protein
MGIDQVVKIARGQTTPTDEVISIICIEGLFPEFFRAEIEAENLS